VGEAVVRSRLGAALLALAAAVPPGAAGDVPDSYRAARRTLWGEVYAEGGTELYCGGRFDRQSGRKLNAEHVYPMSWVTRELRCGTRNQCRERSPGFNRIEADLHNIYPARTDANQRRGSTPFGDVPGEEHAIAGCDIEVDERSRVTEPRPAVRGEIARAMFYVQQTYGMPIYPRQGELLLRWHRADPPDAEERRRNEAIAKVQGRRNPFIDDPGQADRLRFEAPRR
jgi:deoxyribonuclease-1